MEPIKRKYLYRHQRGAELGETKKDFDDTFSVWQMFSEMLAPNRLHGVTVNEEGEAV